MEFSEPYVDPASGDWILNKFDIECIAIGAGIMGCGGGGSPYLGRLRAMEAIKKGKKARVIHPNRYVTMLGCGGRMTTSTATTTSLNMVIATTMTETIVVIQFCALSLIIFP